MNKHYAWAVLASCCALMLGFGMTSNVIGQYFVPVTSDLELGMGQFTLYYAVRGVFLVGSSTLLNKWLERFDARVLLSGCFAVQLLCIGLMASFTKVWHWYVAGAVMGFFLPPVYLVIPPIILSNWFVKKRGSVIGLAMMFTGLGGMIMNPVIGAIIQSHGWRFAYIANAIIAGVIVLPFLIFVVRLKPSDKGLKPYGYEEQAASVGDDAGAGGQSQLKGVSREDAMRSFSFVIMITLFAACGFFAGYPQLITAYGIFVGHPATLASYFLSLCMAGNFLSKLALGFINDKFGGKAMIYSSFCMTMASLLLLRAGVGSLPLLMAGAFFAGSFLSISSVATPLLIHTIYGSRDYTRIFVVLSLSQNTLINFGPSIVGYMFDYSGSYMFSFNFGIVVVAAVAVLAWFSFTTSKKLAWS